MVILGLLSVRPHHITSGVLNSEEPHSSNLLMSWVIVEVLAFSIILVVARKPRQGRHPDIPSLLDAIPRDATHYFLLMFFCIISSDLFLMLAPVGGL